MDDPGGTGGIMRRVVILAAALLFPALALAWPAHVCRVMDGDTLTVAATPEGCANKADRVTVRLYGIDAPEKAQACGDLAAARLRELAGDQVDVDPRARDRYGRTVAVIHAPGMGAAINARLVSEGWAWVYVRYCSDPECPAMRGLELEARASRAGLWSCDLPVPPWKWRRDRKEERKRNAQ